MKASWTIANESVVGTDIKGASAAIFTRIYGARRDFAVVTRKVFRTCAGKGRSSHRTDAIIETWFTGARSYFTQGARVSIWTVTDKC